MYTKKTTLFIIMLVGIMTTFSQIIAKNPITPQNLWEMERVSSLSVSSDYNYYAYTLTKYNIEKNNSETNIYLYNTQTNENKLFTTGKSDNSPQFSPDGKWLAFVSRRGEGTPAQLYIIPLKGGEARKVTNLPVGVSAPKWFPDGKRIAFTASVYPDYDGNFDNLEKTIKERRESKMTAKVTENRIYRFWDRWLTEGMYPRLFAVDIETEKVTDLMPNTSMFFSMMGGAEYDISPDGKKIAISANSTKPPYNDLNYDIYLLDTEGSGNMKNLTESNQAGDYSPKFSADGKKLLYGLQKRTDFYADKVRLGILDIASSNTKVLTEDIDLSFENWVWSEKNNKIYFLAEDSAMKSVFSIDSDGKNLNRIFHNGTNANLVIAESDRLGFLHQNLSAPNEIFTVKFDGSDLKKVTTVNAERLNNISFGKVEDVTYKGADGADIQMFIVYPPDFDESKKYPLVIMIHGGPHGTFGDFFHYRWNAHLFSAPGYVVIMPNFHGSTSFGQDFAVSIHGQHPDKPYRDVMKATDYMINRGFIDETKMAATGGSYGGYLVSWIAGQTDRYACLVNHAGVYDLMLQFGSDITAHREEAYGGTPWENMDIMQKNNPAMNAANFKTPMLIMHGELDYRVPVAQAFVVYGIYKAMGLDARLVYYPNENHWILTPQNSIYWYKELYDWLGRYLK